MSVNTLALGALVTLLVISDPAPQVAAAQTPQATAVILENVRIFDGTSAGLSGPSNVLVAGNVKLIQWMTPAEALELVTHDNAELLALSGPHHEGRKDLQEPPPVV